MKLLRHALVALLANLILLFLALEFNSSLAPLAIYLIVGGIFTVYPAFQLKLIAGLPVVLLTGAIWDAATPGTFGLHVFALGAMLAANLGGDAVALALGFGVSGVAAVTVGMTAVGVVVGGVLVAREVPLVPGARRPIPEVA